VYSGGNRLKSMVGSLLMSEFHWISSRNVERVPGKTDQERL
jgi:hypothetical protein